MSVIVRKAVRIDDKGIYEVEQDSFSIPWSLQAVQRELESERALYYVLEQEDGTIVGDAGLWQGLVGGGDPRVDYQYCLAQGISSPRVRRIAGACFDGSRMGSRLY